ncbi:MAG TPA: hypothetical protein VED59_09130 [Acidimicrobiales bacterium]|nr:hypothetical protein [Acidimicrobiales bacterium]
MAQVDLASALDPAYLAGLEGIPLVELRAKRAACIGLETELSYLRRLAQARIDLILDESERRQQGIPQPKKDLVERLPQILGDYARVEGPGRLPAFLAPPEGAQLELSSLVEELLPADQLASLPAVPQERLDELLKTLGLLEREVSTQRRALHDILNRLQEELVRRYRIGEATVEALLD